MLALLCGAAGTLLFLENFSAGSGSGAGNLLALLSGLFYSVHMIVMDKSGIKNMYYFKLSFYLCLFGAVLSGNLWRVTGQLTSSDRPGLVLRLSGVPLYLCGRDQLIPAGNPVYGCRGGGDPLYPGADHKCDSGRPGFRRAVYHEEDRLCLHSVQRGADCGGGRSASVRRRFANAARPGSGFILLP